MAERYSEASGWWVIALSAALFAIVAVCRSFDDSPAAGVHLFYIIPVILLALRFGTAGGVAGACVALALFLGYALLGGDGDLEVSSWFSPAFTVLIVGVMVGILAGRLRASEQRFRSAAENQLEPFALYSTVRDSDGRIVDFRNVFINEVGAASVGMSREQMVGRLLSELFPGRLEHGLLEQYSAVVESGEPYFSEAVDFINVLGHVELVRAFDVRVAKLDGGIEITWRDITDRKRAEHERDWLASIVENSSDAVMSADLDGLIVSWSGGAERLYGYSREEAIGRTFAMLFSERELPAARAYLERTLSGERPEPVDGVELRKDGAEIRVTFVGWPVLDEAGGVVGSARFVRERRG